MIVHYQDVQTAEEVEPNTYSVMELLREHQVRYVLRTSIGAIVMRHLPYRMKRIIDDARIHIYPSVRELLNEAEYLRPYFEGIPEEDQQEDKRKRMEEIYHLLRSTDMTALGVIVEPPVATMDDVNEIYDRLQPEEAETLSICIQALASVRSDVDSTAMEIAKANGLELVDREILDLMTVSQASYFIDRINKENERIRQMTRQYEKAIQ